VTPPTDRPPTANGVAAIGTQAEVGGFALAGVRIYGADDDAQARAAWRSLPGTVAVVLLTEVAAGALEQERMRTDAPLTVVMPA
jgi:vacuolar-type H+-ATPase subunit F/Vma7